MPELFVSNFNRNFTGVSATAANVVRQQADLTIERERCSLECDLYGSGSSHSKEAAERAAELKVRALACPPRSCPPRALH